MTDQQDPDTLEVSGTLAPPAVSAKQVLWPEAVIRALLAFLFVAILAGKIIGAFCNLGTSRWENTRALLEILLPAETALLGSAVGFYFGTKKSD